jgi:hypothetical protein
MKIQDRVKKIRKMVGVELRHKISPIRKGNNVFTQSGDTSLLVGVVIYSLYDIRLIIHINGSLYVESEDDEFVCNHITEIPLVSKKNGVVKFHQVKTHKNNIKVVFVNSDDYKQSETLVERSVVDMMSKTLKKLDHNIYIQKRCIMEISSMDIFDKVSGAYGFDDATTKDLIICGLTDIGWNNTAPIFNTANVSKDFMLNYRKLIMQKETLTFNLGMAKLNN